MLSWSSRETNGQVDIAAVAEGRAGVGVEHGDELLRFASACAGDDPTELAAAREALVTLTDEAFMVDAAAVAANFEMMTRLADGTGAAMPPERLERSAAEIAVMGTGSLTSRRERTQARGAMTTLPSAVRSISERSASPARSSG